MNEIESVRLMALVAELKSGEYQKGYWKLHQEEEGVHTYCVLGVACELNRQRENKFDWCIATSTMLESYSSKKIYGIPVYDRIEGGHLIEARNMPESIKYWYGFNSQYCMELSNINDRGGGGGIQDNFLEEITYLENLLAEKERNATK